MKLPLIDCGHAVVLAPEAGYLVVVAGLAHIDDVRARRFWLAKSRARSLTVTPDSPIRI